MVVCVRVIIAVQNVQFIPIYNNTLARLMVFMVIENFSPTKQ